MNESIVHNHIRVKNQFASYYLPFCFRGSGKYDGVALIKDYSWILSPISWELHFRDYRKTFRTSNLSKLVNEHALSDYNELLLIILDNA